MKDATIFLLTEAKEQEVEAKVSREQQGVTNQLIIVTKTVGTVTDERDSLQQIHGVLMNTVRHERKALDILKKVNKANNKNKLG